MSLRTTIVNTLLVCFYVGVSGNLQAQTVSILPEPVKLVMQSGTFRLDADVEIVADKAVRQKAVFLAQIIQDKTQINLSVVEKAAQGKRTIRLEVTGKDGHPEGYTLQITPSAVLISAAAEAGIFYGIQSLRQLFPNDISAGIPCLEIEDEPQFTWRALLLDESRYFQGKGAVLKLLDNMSQLKMNVLQWHLTDSPGWRIEIKKYPELTKTGAYRDSTEREGWGDVGIEGMFIDRKPHGGFYTQDEIREIVTYASARSITIVPEIEMPGHADAAIASYPWLGTIRKNIKIPGNFVGGDVFDVTDPKVVEFFHDVLTEIMALFPGKVIHIGGDEVNYSYWKNSPAVSNYMKENGIKTPADLQVDFANKMSRWLASKNRRMMGWNEITGANVQGQKTAENDITKQPLAPGTIVQFWKGDTALIKKEIEDGYDIVNSYHNFTYLDYTYKKISLEKAYSFNPVPEELTVEQRKKVLGLSCQMWTEFVPNEQNMNGKVYPRIAAYAETGWTAPDKKNYSRFLKALDYFLKDWRKQGIEYGPLTK